MLRSSRVYIVIGIAMMILSSRAPPGNRAVVASGGIGYETTVDWADFGDTRK